MTLAELQKQIDAIAQYMRGENFNNLTITLTPRGTYDVLLSGHLNDGLHSDMLQWRRIVQPSTKQKDQT